MIKRLRAFSILLVFLLLALQAKAQEPLSLEQHIEQLQQTVQNCRLLVSELKPDKPLQMPVGIGSNTSDKPLILIDELVLYPDRAEFKAYTALQLPGSSQTIYLATPEPVALSYDGGIAGIARMELVNNQKLRLPGMGDANLQVQKGNTFLEFDCSGFRRAGLGLEIEMPSKLVKETNDERVKGTTTIEFSDLNNLLASIAIEPFRVKGINGFTFTVSEAVIDLSDHANAAGMVFPPDYEQIYLADAAPELWRGVYLRNLSVKLPEELKDRSVNGRKEVAARNLLIDAQGLSGEFIASNVIPFQNGDLGGWAYSIDDLSVGLIASQLKYGSMAGKLNVPISGEEQQLPYTCTFNPGNEYIFNVAAADSMEFKLFAAGQVTLDRGSFVEVALIGSEFEAMASLSGRMSVKASLSGTEGSDKTGNQFTLGDVKFEQLLVSTQAPYLHSGNFDFTSSVKVGTFEASISNIKLVKQNELRGLGIDLKVGLMGKADATNSFAADASLLVLGQISNENGRQHYTYSKTEFSRIGLDIDQGAYSLRGELNFFRQDATFGSGFKGQLIASMKPGITVGATALFGSIDGLNYWYADALAEFATGIPITPVLEVNGFAGGLYYAVKQKPGSGGNIAVVNSQTGLAYLPDATAGLGVRAAVRFGTSGKQEMMNGNVGFEMVFHKGGGLSQINLIGNVNFLEDPLPDVGGQLKAGSKALANTEPGSGYKASAHGSMNKRGALAASMFIDYDLDNSSLFANFDAYINVAGGALKGIHTGGLAGEGVIYFAPNNWYIHLGTPQTPVGIELVGLAKTTSYFMAGKNLPGSSPPPANVSQILGGRNLDYMRDLNALNSGLGMAFGSSLHFDTGNLTFLVFYARFAAGAGFDVMLKDYGNEAMCEGRSGPIGINGWYANGQVYAYVQGNIGIKVNIFGKKGKYDIIDLGVATALQAKMPNPTWMHGTVGGNYRILGGLVKGKCSFEFTVGSECKVIGTDAFAEAGVKVIAEVTPTSGAKEVDVFAIPQALFNIPVGEQFSISDANGKSIFFRAKLDHFRVSDGSIAIPGTLEWNTDGTVLAFNPTEVLPSNRSISVTAKISFEENRNGAWIPYLLNGKPYEELIGNTFVSGQAPDHIPASNIAYSYPVMDQLNYYKNESKAGYIKLKRGQGYLFDAQNDFLQTGRLQAVTGEVKEFAVAYADGQVNFTMPELSNDKGYKLAIIAVPKTASATIESNVKTEEATLVSEKDSDVTVTTRKSVGTLTSAEEKQTFLMNFRSSLYSSFSEKMDKVTNAYSYTKPIRNGVTELGYIFRTQELFDDFEINEEGKETLVRLEADLTGNSWYQAYIYPYVYQNYPVLSNLTINWRSPVDKLGAPPVRAVYINNNRNITGLRYSSNQSGAIGDLAVFVYNLPYYIERDYHELQWKVANTYAGGGAHSIPGTMLPIIQTTFSPVTRGNYVIKASYTLPGTNKVTSTKLIVIKNEDKYQ
ncbi:hypothetical protein [Pontibacter kalidii]|uniref:hypothetical protein n=1 Tax=Pontibacter kalidii TaxID=2592049 RepID=UPI00224ECD4A|nr:hypothetical protein [Pontibacter kalidii]